MGRFSVQHPEVFVVLISAVLERLKASFWSRVVLAWLSVVAVVFACFVCAMVAFTHGARVALDTILSPPSNTTMYTYLTRAIGINEVERNTGTIGTTPGVAFATDLAAAKRTDAYVQQFTVRNASADVSGTGDLLCYGETVWSGVSTCATLCAASGLTCTGTASTDGDHITPGQVLNTREDGTVCGCVVARVASTAFQTKRIVR